MDVHTNKDYCKLIGRSISQLENMEANISSVRRPEAFNSYKKRKYVKCAEAWISNSMQTFIYMFTRLVMSTT
jgi:hypothetical protein